MWYVNCQYQIDLNNVNFLSVCNVKSMVTTKRADQTKTKVSFILLIKWIETVDGEFQFKYYVLFVGGKFICSISVTFFQIYIFIHLETFH